MSKVFEPEVLPPLATEERGVILAPRVVNLDIDLNQIIGIGLGIVMNSLISRPLPKTRKAVTKARARGRKNRRNTR